MFLFHCGIKEVDRVHSYVHVLEMYKAFVPCDHTLHHFVLQELNSDNLYLKVCSNVYKGVSI